MRSTCETEQQQTNESNAKRASSSGIHYYCYCWPNWQTIVWRTCNIESPPCNNIAHSIHTWQNKLKWKNIFLTLSKNRHHTIPCVYAVQYTLHTDTIAILNAFRLGRWVQLRVEMRSVKVRKSWSGCRHVGKSFQVGQMFCNNKCKWTL